MKRKEILLVAPVCLAALTGPAYGQGIESTGEQMPDQPPAPVTAADNNSVPEIVVTAQKKAENIRDVPATILVQDTEALIRSGVRSATDLGNAFPGLVFAKQATSAQPAIRGVTSVAVSGAGGIEQPVAIYIDGIYSPSQAANLAFDPTMVSRIEVLKGPQGTVFGRNVVGGAILVYTRDPNLDEVTGDASVTLSRFGGGGSKAATNNEQRLFISAPLVKDELATSLSVVRTMNPGFYRDITPGSNGRYGRTYMLGLQGKLLWEPSDAVRVVLSGRYSHQEQESGITNAGPSLALERRPDGTLLFPDVVAGRLPWEVAHDTDAVSDVKSYAVSLRADFEADIGTFTSLSAFQKVTPIQRTDTDGTYSPLCQAIVRCSDLRFNYKQPSVISQEIDFASAKFGPFSFVAGVYGLHVSNETEANLNANTFLYLTKSTTDSFAGFGEATLDLAEGLSAIAGIRYSYDTLSIRGTNITTAPLSRKNTNSWSAATSRLGLKYKASEQLNFYATFSQGYKSGLLSYSSFNRLVNGVVTPTVPPAPVDPERLNAFEAGVKFANRTATLNVAGFYYDYKDLQVQSFVNNAIVTSNAARAKIYGFDLDGSLNLADGLRLSGGGSWLPHAKYESYVGAQIFPVLNGRPVSRSMDASGERLIRSPEWVVSAALDYTAELGGGKADFNATFNHSSRYKYDVAGFLDQPAFSTLALSASYTPTGSGITATIYGRNVTNKAYTTGSVVNDNAYNYYYAAPREVGVSLEYSF